MNIKNMNEAIGYLEDKYKEVEKVNEEKLAEAIDFLGEIVDEADGIICLLEEIEVKLAKLDKKSRQLKEDGQNARSLIEWELNKTI